MILELIIGILTLVAEWMIFKKMGRQGWEGIVPFYNTYVLCQELYGNGWKFLLLLIPIYNIILSIQTQVRLAKAFGKSGGFAAGLIFLPYIFIPLLAFGGTAYQGVPVKTAYQPPRPNTPYPNNPYQQPGVGYQQPGQPQGPYSQPQQAPYAPPQQTAAAPAFCPSCGAKSSGEKFCQNCGAPLR